MGFFSKLIGGVNSFLGSPLGDLTQAAGAGLISSAGARRQNEAYIQNTEDQRRFNAGEAIKNREFQTASNAKAMAFSAEQALKNRRFQQRMSNTAHQREIRDLERAGLNPILSAKYGGSSSPPGASASGVTSGGSAASSQSANAVDVLTPGVSTAMQRFRLSNEMRLIKAQTETQENQATLLDEQAGTQSALTDHYRTQADVARATMNPNIDYTVAKTMQSKASKDMELARLLSEQVKGDIYSGAYGHALKLMEMLGIKPTSAAYQLFKDRARLKRQKQSVYPDSKEAARRAKAKGHRTPEQMRQARRDYNAKLRVE